MNIFQDINDTVKEKNLKNSIYEAAALHNIGLAEYHLARPRQALAFFNQALEIRQKQCSSCPAKNQHKFPENPIKIYSVTVQTLGTLGIVYFSMNNDQTAIEFYQKAIKIYQQNNQQEELAKLMNYIGLACYKQNHISQSLWYHLKAWELFEKIQYPQQKDNYLPHILSVYQRFNLADDGVKLYQRVQQLFHLMETEVS